MGDPKTAVDKAREARAFASGYTRILCLSIL